MLSNDSLVDLQSGLLKILPDTIHGADNKASKSNFIPTEEALHCKFIRYGTKKSLQILMFDIDNAGGTVEDYHEHIFNTIGIYPTFTLKTDNGFHFGLLLDSIVWRTKYDSTATTVDAQIASSIKEHITKLLSGDIHGSKRLIGIWRNPLLHNTVYSGNEFNLLELAKLFNISKPLNQKIEVSNINTKMKMGNNKIQQTIDKGFYIGNRNNYLFAAAYKIVFQDRRKVLTIHQELQQINDSFSNGLTEYEVKKIADSVLKLEPTMFNPKRKAVRGKLSNEMWEKGIHGLRNRRSYAGFTTSLNRTLKTACNLTESLINLFERGLTKPTNKQVSKEASISVRQYQRVKHTIKRVDIFMSWLNSLGENIDIRAYVTPLYQRVWKLINTLVKRVDYSSSAIYLQVAMEYKPPET